MNSIQIKEFFIDFIKLKYLQCLGRTFLKIVCFSWRNKFFWKTSEEFIRTYFVDIILQPDEALLDWLVTTSSRIQQYGTTWHILILLWFGWSVPSALAHDKFDDLKSMYWSAHILWENVSKSPLLNHEYTSMQVTIQ